MITKNIALPAAFCLFLSGLWGCTATIALQGLSSGAPVAFSSTGAGKGDSAWLAHYDDVVQATLRAGRALSLTLEKKEIGPDKSAFYYRDDQGTKMKISIERRTETLTYARFNMGLSGSTSIGRLMARQIVYEMVEGGKFLRNWHPEEVE